jgi:hypothetical protein
MPDRRIKPPPRHTYRQESSDRLVRVNYILRSAFLGGRLLRGNRARYVALPEPEEDLEGSELSEFERQQAIARERTRREGLI